MKEELVFDGGGPSGGSGGGGGGRSNTSSAVVGSGSSSSGSSNYWPPGPLPSPVRINGVRPELIGGAEMRPPRPCATVPRAAPTVIMGEAGGVRTMVWSQPPPQEQPTTSNWPPPPNQEETAAQLLLTLGWLFYSKTKRSMTLVVNLLHTLRKSYMCWLRVNRSTV